MNNRDASVGKQIFTVPNGITAARLLCVVGMAYFFLHDQMVVGGIIAVIALFSDWLDGYIARAYGASTAFGARFDVLTDKALLAVLLWPLFFRELSAIDAVLLYTGCVVALLTALFQMYIVVRGVKVTLFQWEKSPVIISMCGVTLGYLSGDTDLFSQTVIGIGIALWVIVAGRVFIRSLRTHRPR
jgi:phosphatidylglycerophosphate synthase